jgi:hypothetical protein
MGLFEYLQWIEDMGMQPIMGVWDGYTLDGTSQPESALGPYIQDAIDQVQKYVPRVPKGPTKTTLDQLRHRKCIFEPVG